MCRDEANFLEVVDLEAVVDQDETSLERKAIVCESTQDNQQKEGISEYEKENLKALL